MPSASSLRSWFPLLHAVALRLAAGLATMTGLAGCATAPAVPVEAAPAKTTYRTVERPIAADASEAPFERDRRSILAMLGEYQVRFAFQETTVLAPGYSRRVSKDTGAFETVVLVEDGSRRIVMQHLLVSDDGQHVTKHWRQDWIYEAASRFEFTEAQTWRIRPLPPAVTRGAWTQCVYEVSDAPRYCGTGRWTYDNGVATWNSDHTWRPLPRREYTVRSDYNALEAVNRHSITPSGWTHEQDNTKTRREGEKPTGSLVREFGFNDYRRIEGFDFKAAYGYWASTKDYWAQVRAAWAARFDANGGLSLKTQVDGMSLIIPLFTQAAAVAGGEAVGAEQIAKTFDEWVVPPGTPNTREADGRKEAQPAY